jgi:RNA polymerase sigma-70 factor (ECF subfamily)
MTDIRSVGESRVGDEVVVAARSDREAFGRLYDSLYPEVLRYALRRMLVRAAAEDVTSDVFLQVARHLGRFPGTTLEHFRRWLFRIATNEINGRLRQSLRRAELLAEAVRIGAVRGASECEAQPGEPLSGEPSVWESVYAALGELTEREQSIVSLRYFAGLDSEQIAGTLEMTGAAVRAALSRALARLRDRLRLERMYSPPDEQASGGKP